MEGKVIFGNLPNEDKRTLLEQLSMLRGSFWKKTGGRHRCFAHCLNCHVLSIFRLKAELL